MIAYWLVYTALWWDWDVDWQLNVLPHICSFVFPTQNHNIPTRHINVLTEEKIKYFTAIIA